MSLASKYAVQLKRGYNVYLGGHAQMDVTELAITIIELFFKEHVPGFGDLLLATNTKRMRQILRALRDNEIWLTTPYGLGDKHFNAGYDLFWIENQHVTFDQIKHMERRAFIKGIPVLYSGCKPAELQIISDTREQRPIWQGKDCKRLKLDVGDYTTEKLINKFHVERKSLQDLYGSIVQGHVRFRNELIRASANDIKLCLYVEGTKKDFTTLNFPGGDDRKIKPETLKKIINTVETRYGIEVVWCNSREHMKRKIYQRLKLEQTKL